MFGLGQVGATTRNPSTSSSFFIRDILGSDRTCTNNDFNTNGSEKFQTTFDHTQTLSMGLSATPFIAPSYPRHIPTPGTAAQTAFAGMPPYSSVYSTLTRGFPLDSMVELRDAMTVPIPLPVYVRSRSPDDDDYMKPRKCRRSRTVFTELQLMGLEKKFESQKYLSTPERIELADTLGLSQLQVKTWYQNRRMKWKKLVLQRGAKEPPTKPKGRPRKDNSEAESENHEQQTDRHFSMISNNSQSPPLIHCDYGASAVHTSDKAC